MEHRVTTDAMEDVTFVCKVCGSDRIQEPAWVEMNTEIVVGTGNEGPGHAGNTYCYWCPECAERGAG
jgi:hypothetical protein